MSQELPENFDGQQATEVQQAEKLIPQSKVNEIVANVRREAYEKASRRPVEEPQMQQAQYQSPPVQQSGMMGGMPDVNRMVSDAVQQQLLTLSQQHYKEQQEAHGRAVAEEFAKKVTNSEAYRQNREGIESLPWQHAGRTIELANMFDNTAEIAAEFARNPIKFSAINDWSSKDPDYAMKLMRDLSESIKNNDAAKSMQFAGEPLSQIKSSPNATDNGAKTVSDFRKLFR